MTTIKETIPPSSDKANDPHGHEVFLTVIMHPTRPREMVANFQWFGGRNEHIVTSQVLAHVATHRAQWEQNSENNLCLPARAEWSDVQRAIHDGGWEILYLHPPSAMTYRRIGTRQMI